MRFLACVLKHCATWEILLQNGPEGRAVYAMVNKLLNRDLFIPAHLHGTDAFYFSVFDVIFHAIQFYVLKFTSVQATGVKKFIFSPKALEGRRLVLLCTSMFGNRCALET